MDIQSLDRVIAMINSDDVELSILGTQIFSSQMTPDDLEYLKKKNEEILKTIKNDKETDYKFF